MSRAVASLGTVLCLVAALSALSARACPDECSGHGYCTKGTQMDECVCEDGFTGPSCAERLCPSSTAWADYAIGANVAHRELTECSNMGHCDRSTGQCQCRYGFTGAACERMRCPEVNNSHLVMEPCGGHGRCMSMGEAAAYQDYDLLTRSITYTDWDADMMHGCVCDSGWEGFDCSLKACPKGDDPLTIGRDEHQLFECTAATTSSNYVRLSFRGETTKAIPADAVDELVEFRLEELSTIGDVQVTLSKGNLCTPAGSVATIRFLTEHGNTPTMVIEADTTGGTTAMVVDGTASAVDGSISSQSGNKEWVECSNRGTCDRETGMCTCYSGFKSSNGRGESGTLGDCGFRDTSVSLSTCATVTPVWGSTLNNSVCSGVGTCNTSTLACSCNSGYHGGACEFKTCSNNNAWFDDAIAPTTAHVINSDRKCSNGGICNEAKGTCSCEDTFNLFGGAACGTMRCAPRIPDDPERGTTNRTCGAVGVCLTMTELAQLSKYDGSLISGASYSSLWDADMIRTCHCDRILSVDNRKIDVNTLNETLANKGAYMDSVTGRQRTPFAWAVTDYTGFDCSQATCPTGDNPRTDGVDEIQTVSCSADGGNFTLSFRMNASAVIKYNANVSTVAEALEASRSIHDVTVSFANSSSRFCVPSTASWTNVVSVTFHSENGPLPLMTATNNYLTSGTVNIARTRRGTKENLECGGVGTCDRNHGNCTCTDGFFSSDGQGGVGQRGDCGFFDEWGTARFLGSQQDTREVVVDPV